MAAAAPPAQARDDLSEIVVTGSKRERGVRATAAARSPADMGRVLREVAARGRARDVERLLDRGAPIDAADEAGETALMKAIQARKPAIAGLLLRRGASLDVKNRAGVSARDMARAVGDAELNAALGLPAPR